MGILADTCFPCSYCPEGLGQTLLSSMASSGSSAAPLYISSSFLAREPAIHRRWGTLSMAVLRERTQGPAGRMSMVRRVVVGELFGMGGGIRGMFKGLRVTADRGRPGAGSVEGVGIGRG